MCFRDWSVNVGAAHLYGAIVSLLILRMKRTWWWSPDCHYVGGTQFPQGLSAAEQWFPNGYEAGRDLPAACRSTFRGNAPPRTPLLWASPGDVWASWCRSTTIPRVGKGQSCTERHASCKNDTCVFLQHQKWILYRGDAKIITVVVGQLYIVLTFDDKYVIHEKIWKDESGLCYQTWLPWWLWVNSLTVLMVWF